MKSINKFRNFFLEIFVLTSFFFSYIKAPDATLPSYEEVMNVVRQEEKREWNEKQR